MSCNVSAAVLLATADTRCPVLRQSHALNGCAAVRAGLVTKRNGLPQNVLLFDRLRTMPVIRFVREGRDVECYPGENLRDVALREGVELYGLKGRLGNCNGCGQCITCFVEIQGASDQAVLSPRTSVEDLKLKRRPDQWRLACQALVQRSVVVLTKPQTGLPDRQAKLDAACATPLPEGPTAWPAIEIAQEEVDGEEADGSPSLDSVGVTAATPGDEG